ncbi:KxYKxGKxW signal peptide domain-containing protein [Fructilactobacillus sanfranciscensis]
MNKVHYKMFKAGKNG